MIRTKFSQVVDAVSDCQSQDNVIGGLSEGVYPPKKAPNRPKYRMLLLQRVVGMQTEIQQPYRAKQTCRSSVCADRFTSCTRHYTLWSSESATWLNYLGKMYDTRSNTIYTWIE